MTCPFCGDEMRRGEVEVDGTLGLERSTSINWRPEGARGGRTTRVLVWFRGRGASSCDRCGAIVLDPTNPVDSAR